MCEYLIKRKILFVIKLTKLRERNAHSGGRTVASVNKELLVHAVEQSWLIEI